MADYHSIIARAISSLPSTADEARHAIYEQARTALHERLGNDPQISDTELVNEHYRLEEAIYEVEEDLLLSEMRRFVREDLSPPGLSFISKIKEFVRSVGDKFPPRGSGQREGLKPMDDLTCPICKSSTEELPHTGDATGYQCATHGNFKVADTVFAEAKANDYTQEQWEAALDKAVERTEPDEWPLIIIDDFY